MIPRIDMISTGKRIYDMVKIHNVRIGTIRELCGFTTDQSVYKWFRGDAIPKLDNLVILAELFSCKIDDLLVIIT